MTFFSKRIFLATTCALALTIFLPSSARADGELLPGVGLLAGAVGGGFIGNQFGRGIGNDIAVTTGMVAGGAIGYGVGEIAKDGAPYWRPVGGTSTTGYGSPRYYQSGSSGGGYTPNYVGPGDQ